MRAEDLQGNALVTTAAVAEAAKDPETLDYIQMCLSLFFSGMYGKMGPDDTELNEEELRAGEGRIMARYEAQGKLTEDIYIIAYFSQSNPGDIDYNNTTVLYCGEY